MLADEIATLAKRLATDTIPQDYIPTLLICRLVLLKKKDNGIRPVGVGECLRQIVGKTITGLPKEDIRYMQWEHCRHVWDWNRA